MQYRGSLGSYVQSTWLFESDSGTAVVCWAISWTTADDEEHDDKEEEEEEDDDCWLEDLLLFLLFLPLRESAAAELAFCVSVVMRAEDDE